MEQIESRLNDVSIKNNDAQTIETKWGWSLMDLYRSALSFYKGRSKKPINIIRIERKST